MLHFIFKHMTNREVQLPANLGGILEKYQAPTEARSSIGRRAGLVVARGQLPLKTVEEVIVDSMITHGGQPDWSQVSTKVGRSVNTLYRDTRNRRW